MQILKKLRKQRVHHKFEYEELINTSLNRTVVLVIGESLSKSHMSLYGYNRKTNPLLENVDSLLIFDKIITPATQTRESIIRMLSLATIEDETPYIKQGSIISLAKSIGFSTYWISNQMMLGISDTETTVLAKDTDKQWFINTDWNTNSLDENVLPIIDEVLKEQVKNKFIIIHLLGNHFKYNKRYKPIDQYLVKTLSNFPNYLSESQKQIIKNYDNSVKYNDYIVNSLLAKIKNISGISNFIYLSDHGEDVYDTKKQLLGHGSPNVTRHVTDIPFIMYNNDNYYKTDGRSYTYFDSISSRKHSAVNLFYSLADLLWVDFIDYNGELSLFSKDYKEQKIKVINSNKQILNYNEIIQSD